VPLVLHLSDIHLVSGAPEQDAILEGLYAAVRNYLAESKAEVDLLAITGDVFDSASLDPGHAARAFRALYDGLSDAMGREAPAVIVPGNHDRRRKGLVGPHRGDLVRALSRVAPQTVHVHGNDIPFLARVVPKSFHGLPASVIAYDSTYLPTGYISAGGIVRQEDLLHAAAHLDKDDNPVILLVHHHLVPTPLTDLGVIEPPPERWLRYGLQRILPEIVANADREELTMTALGAGTALSTLHTLRRAVLVLHGHKHYATARHLRHTVVGHGDVLLVSAGSAGTAEKWSPAGTSDAARLWPSFNAVRFDGGELTVETVSFGYKDAKRGRIVVRPLVSARQDGARWSTLPIRMDARGPIGPELEANESLCRLVPSNDDASTRWDVVYERRVSRLGESPHRYLEQVEGIPGAKLVVLDADLRTRETLDVPGRLDLELGSPGITRYRLENGVCRTAAEADKVYGPRTAPYEWIGLMNRYACKRTRLVVTGLGDAAREAFASITDLGTGLEEPATLTRAAGDEISLTVAPCEPRTLLRIYWPLDLGPRHLRAPWTS
jgi:3',5'-cyclic AMP phosphodiesterase CpdA